jgi:hypothetical protein
VNSELYNSSPSKFIAAMLNIFKCSNSKTIIEKPIETYKMNEAYISQENDSPISESGTLFSDSTWNSRSSQNSDILKLRVNTNISSSYSERFSASTAGGFWDEPNTLISDLDSPKNRFGVPLSSTHDHEFERMLQELNEPVGTPFALERSDKIDKHKHQLLQEARMENQRQKEISDTIKARRRTSSLIFYMQVRNEKCSKPSRGLVGKAKPVFVVL